MAKRMIVGVIATVLVALVWYVVYEIGRFEGYKTGRLRGLTEGYEKTSLDRYPVAEQYSKHKAFRVDYPLIDVHFDSNSDWVVVNHRFEAGLRGDSLEAIEILRKDRGGSLRADEFQLMTGYLCVKSFGTGLGITPDGEILIYQNGKLAKAVMYADYVRITDPDLQALFKPITERQLKQLLSASHRKP